jgi:hypothetical protein
MNIKILFIILLLVLTPITASAQIPFGGKILTVRPCTCSGGWFMRVLDLTTGAPIPIVFQFGLSRLNANFNIFTPNTNVLGSYTPGGVCLAGYDCTPKFVIGTITPFPLPGVGTSAF